MLNLASGFHELPHLAFPKARSMTRDSSSAKSGRRKKGRTPARHVPIDRVVFAPNPNGPFVAAAIFCVAILVYLPVLNGRFLWDDQYAIGNNLLLRNGSGLWKIWTTLGNIPQEEHYWPLTYTFFWAQWRAWGSHSVGFHAFNIVLNAAIAVQIWRVMRRLALPGAVLAALIFALHPVHVEAVAWVTSLKDLLATALSLVAIEFWLIHEKRGRPKWLILCAIAILLAMLSKSSALMTPAAIAILIWYRRGRLAPREIKSIALLAAVALAVAIFDMWVVRHNKMSEAMLAPPLLERFAQSGRAFWFYAQKLVWPANLSPVYPRWQLSSVQFTGWVPLLLIAGVTAALWFLRRRIGRGPLACWLYYGITLGPTLGIIYFGFLAITPAADRYQYLASLGPLVGIGALIGGYLRDRPRYHAAVALPLIALAAGSWIHSAHYFDQKTLFSRARPIAPQSAYVCYNLGVGLSDDRRYDEAEKMYAEAMRLKPDHWLAVCNYGLCLINRNKIRDAVSLFDRAVDGGCREPTLLCNLAWLMATSEDPRIRNPRKALNLATEIQKSREKDPMYLSALAAAQAANGHTGMASATVRQAIRLAIDLGMPDQVPKLQELQWLYDQGKTFVTPRE